MNLDPMATSAVAATDFTNDNNNNNIIATASTNAATSTTTTTAMSMCRRISFLLPKDLPPQLWDAQAEVRPNFFHATHLIQEFACHSTPTTTTNSTITAAAATTAGTTTTTTVTSN